MTELLNILDKAKARLLRMFVVDERLYGSQIFHRTECGLDPGSIIQALKG